MRWEQTCRLFIAARVDSALGLCKGSMYSSKTNLKTVRGFRDNRAAKSKVLFSWSPQSLKMNTLCTRVSVKTVTKQRAYIWLAWHVVGGGKLFPGLQRACAPTWNICHTDGRDCRNKTWSCLVTPAAWGLRQEDGKFRCCLENLDPVSKPEVTRVEAGGKALSSAPRATEAKKKNRNKTHLAWIMLKRENVGVCMCG